MALSATVSVSPSTVLPNQAFKVSLVISNSGPAAVNILTVLPSMSVSGALPDSDSDASGSVSIPGASLIPAGGSLSISWSSVVYAPQSGSGSANPASLTYNVSALITASDGSVFSPAAPAALTANAPVY